MSPHPTDQNYHTIRKLHALSERCCVSGTPGATAYTARRNSELYLLKNRKQGCWNEFLLKLEAQQHPMGWIWFSVPNPPQLHTGARPQTRQWCSDTEHQHWQAVMPPSQRDPIQWIRRKTRKSQCLLRWEHSAGASSMCCRSIQPHYLRKEELLWSSRGIVEGSSLGCKPIRIANMFQPLAELTGELLPSLPATEPGCRADLASPAPVSQPPAQALGMSKAKQAFCTSPASVGFCPPSALLSQAEEFLK